MIKSILAIVIYIFALPVIFVGLMFIVWADVMCILKKKFQRHDWQYHITSYRCGIDEHSRYCLLCGKTEKLDTYDTGEQDLIIGEEDEMEKEEYPQEWF